MIANHINVYRASRQTMQIESFTFNLHSLRTHNGNKKAERHRSAFYGAYGLSLLLLHHPQAAQLQALSVGDAH